MTTPASPTLDDYDAIAAAVMETERGRWFLAEFARRNRAADTAQILEALAALAAMEQRFRPAEPKPVVTQANARLERLTPLLERLKAAAARLRATLGSAAAPQRRIDVAQNHLLRIERAVEIALSIAAGAKIPPKAAATQSEPAAAEPIILAPAIEPLPEDVVAREARPAEDVVVPLNGGMNGAYAMPSSWTHEPDDAPEPAAPAAYRLDREPQRTTAVEPVRPARRNTLLEGLSDAEKGLLFS